MSPKPGTETAKSSFIEALCLLHGNIRRTHNSVSNSDIIGSDFVKADTNSAGQFPIFSPKGLQQSFQVYGQSVINVDGMLEKSLAAVVRVPREQPRNEIMPNDEPDTTSSGKNHCTTT